MRYNAIVRRTAREYVELLGGNVREGVTTGLEIFQENW